MASIHCLWIGLLSGLIASKLIRGRAAKAPVGSAVAVGALGALLGGLADSWLVGVADGVPHGELVWPAVGAALALAAWAVAQRSVFAAEAGEKSSDRA
jgi:uncharacterized membrane protein YeaQ/YmgE (transglycosylase-associated protein family)